MIAVRWPSRAAATATLARGAAEVLAEGLDVLQADADLQRVDVDAGPAEGQDLEPGEPLRRLGTRLAGWSSLSFEWVGSGSRGPSDASNLRVGADAVNALS